jgi:hypothetical protein
MFNIFRRAQPIGPLADGDRTLGAGPKGQTRDAEIGCLLLYTARIGDGQPAVEHQVHQRDVAHLPRTIAVSRAGNRLCEIMGTSYIPPVKQFLFFCNFNRQEAQNVPQEVMTSTLFLGLSRRS